MKSLVESLFDSKTQTMESLFDKDLVTKTIKFGDWFEFRYNTPFKTKPIIDAFYVNALKQDLKIKGRDKFEVIINAVRKIVENISIIGGESSEQLGDKIKEKIDPYLTTQYSNGSYNVDVYNNSKRSDFNHLNDVDEVAIFIASKVGVFYKRKSIR